MQKLKENVYVSDDDKEIIGLIGLLKDSGTNFPEVPKNAEVDLFCPIVGFDGKRFILQLFCYSAKEGDSGWSYYRIEDFIGDEPFNFLCMERYIDPAKLLMNVNMAIERICKRINYPVSLALVMSGEFAGFKQL